MASKRSPDHLKPDNSPPYKKTANGLVSPLDPTSHAPRSSSYVQSRTSSALKIVKLPVAQSTQWLSEASALCSRPVGPHTLDLDAGRPASVTVPSDRRVSAVGFEPQDHVRALHQVKEKATPSRQPQRRPSGGSSDLLSTSGTLSVARTQLANIGNTIASLEAQLHEARQQIVLERHNAKCEQQLAEDNANTIVSLRSELADAQVSLDEIRRTQTRLEEANANLKARCNDFSRERSEKLALQEELKEEQAAHDQLRQEKTALEQKLEHATKRLAEHVENVRMDTVVRDLLNLVDPTDLERIATTLTKLKSLLDGRG